MQWIKTGRQIGQAVKNVQRLKQMIAVFAKHGFADVMVRMDLGKFVPARWGIPADTASGRSVPLRLRLAFEELGPTFVKFGQLLSTRSDLFPASFIEEFTQLQDNVHPLSFDIVRSVVESELGKKIEDAYSFFNPQPLASASIGQVHEAILLTGEKVVVKVQRPEIQKSIETDISLLAFFAQLLEKYVSEIQILSPTRVVDEFNRTLSYELDYIIESNNILKITENSLSLSDVVIPKVYPSLTTPRVLTLERLEGLRVNDKEGLNRAGIDLKKIVEVGARAFFKWVMIDGLFHGDLHGGNLFVLPGNKIGIVDFGIVGRLSQKSRDQLANMVMSLLNEDYESLCYEYAEVASAESSVDMDGFQREVRNSLSPHMGLALSQLNVGKILIEATQVAVKFNMKIPGDWMLVFKAILTIEGMGRSLDPEFDLLSMGQSLVKDLVKNQYSMQRITKEVVWIAKDLAALLKVLPRQIRWMFKKFNRNDFALEIKSPQLELIRNQLDINAKRTSLALLTVGFFIASSMVMLQKTQDFPSVRHQIWNYPAGSVLFFGLGCFSLIAFLYNLRR